MSYSRRLESVENAETLEEPSDERQERYQDCGPNKEEPDQMSEADWKIVKHVEHHRSHRRKENQLRNRENTDEKAPLDGGVFYQECGDVHLGDSGQNRWG